MVDGQGMAGHSVPSKDQKAQDTSYIALVSDSNACETRPGTAKGKTAAWMLLAGSDRSMILSDLLTCVVWCCLCLLSVRTHVL